MRKTHKQRLDQEYIVTPYSIEMYSQPPWEILETHRFEPEPTHSIRMSLRFPDGGVEDLYFTCAPAGGEYKLCNYVSRKSDSHPAPSPPVVVDLVPLFNELRTVISTGIRSIGCRVGEQGVGLMRLDYSVDPYPCAVSIYPYYEQLDESSWQSMVHPGGEYLHSNLLAQNYRAVIEGTPQLVSIDSRRVDLAHKSSMPSFRIGSGRSASSRRSQNVWLKRS